MVGYLICRLSSNFRDFTWTKFSGHNLLSLVLKDQKLFLSLARRVPLIREGIVNKFSVCSSKGQALQLTHALDFLSIQPLRGVDGVSIEGEDEHLSIPRRTTGGCATCASNVPNEPRLRRGGDPLARARHRRQYSHLQCRERSAYSSAALPGTGVAGWRLQLRRDPGRNIQRHGSRGWNVCGIEGTLSNLSRVRCVGAGHGDSNGHQRSRAHQDHPDDPGNI